MADDRAKQFLKPSWDSVVLDTNDCFMYELELTRLIKRLLPDNRMHGRYIAMLKLLSTQARKFTPEPNE